MNCPRKRAQILALLLHAGYRSCPTFLALHASGLLPNEELSKSDVLKACSLFGTIGAIHCQDKFLLIEFPDPVSAFFAWRCLNGMRLQPRIRLHADWPSPLQQYVSGIKYCKLSSPYSPLKFICRFLIEMQGGEGFQLVRKLIGPGGDNMKKIVDRCKAVVKGEDSDPVKLRVRGRGSGFREGPLHEESDQPLQLCVTSRYEKVYLQACALAEQLLNSLQAELECYSKKKGISSSLRVDKLQSQNSIQKTLKSWPKEQLLEEQTIAELVEARHNSRRAQDYDSADRIRAFLAERGVVLSDERGVHGSSWRKAD